jgi:hypothetical protein
VGPWLVGTSGSSAKIRDIVSFWRESLRHRAKPSLITEKYNRTKKLEVQHGLWFDLIIVSSLGPLARFVRASHTDPSIEEAACHNARFGICISNLQKGVDNQFWRF